MDHSILVTKLDHYGIRGVAKKWLSSYLENRKQYVCFISFHCWHNTQAALENNMAFTGLPQLPDSLLAMLNSPDLNLSGPVFQPGLAGCGCCNLLSMGLSCWCRKTKVDACTQTEESALSVAGRFIEQDLKKTGTHAHRLLVVSYYIGSR